MSASVGGALVELPGGVQGEQLGGAQLGGHVGQLEADALEPADGPAELLAGGRVGRGQSERAFGPPRQVAATDSRVEPSHSPASSSPLPSSPRRASAGSADVVELQDRVRVAPVRDVAVALVHEETRRVQVHQERRHRRPIGVVLTRPRQQDHEVRLVGVADEVLGAADRPVTVIPYGAGTDGAHVRACARFGHGQAVGALAAHAGQEVALALGRRPGQQDVRGPDDAGVVQGVARPAELLLEQHQRHRVEPGPADLLGHVGGVQPGRERLGPDLGDQLGAYRAGPLDLLLVREELALDERAGHLDDAALLVGQGEVHGARQY